MAGRTTPVDEAFKDHQKCMRKLLEREDYSDVTLTCKDGKIFKAHKAILCAHSEFFSRALQPDIFIEGHTSQVNLEVGDSAIIAKLLEYLYLAEYDDTSSIGDGVSSLWLNAKLYTAADFYVIPSLKKAARAKFKQSMTELCGHPEPKDGLSELPGVMEFIYENTMHEDGSGLRNTAVKIIVLHSTNLFNCDEGFAGLGKVMEKTGAFGRDVSIALLKKWHGFRKVICQQCWHTWADHRQDIPDARCPNCLAQV